MPVAEVSSEKNSQSLVEGLKPVRPLHHRLLRHELDDRADRDTCRPWPSGRPRAPRRDDRRIGDEVIADARHRVDVLEVGRAELGVLHDERRRCARPLRGLAVRRLAARLGGRGRRRRRMTGRSPAARDEEQRRARERAPHTQPMLLPDPRGIDRDTDPTASGFTGPASLRVEPGPLPGRDRLQRSCEQRSPRRLDPPPRHDRLEPAHISSGGASSQVTVTRRCPSANDHAPATPAPRTAPRDGRRCRSPSGSGSLLDLDVHAEVRAVRHGLR